MSGLNDENLLILTIVKQVIFAIVQRIFLFDYNNEFQEILWKISTSSKFARTRQRIRLHPIDESFNGFRFRSVALLK